LHCVFEQAEWKLSRKEILDVWPYQYPIPSRVYLWGLLERRFASGRLRRDGSGVKNAPYRYWSESREKEWRDNLGMQLRLEQDELMEKLRIEHGMF
jgi:hypothetical protein